MRAHIGKMEMEPSVDLLRAAAERESTLSMDSRVVPR